MAITLKKWTKIATQSQHTSMTMRDIAALIRVSIVSRNINQQNKFGTVSPKKKNKCECKRKTKPQTDT